MKIIRGSLNSPCCIRQVSDFCRQTCGTKVPVSRESLSSPFLDRSALLSPQTGCQCGRRTCNVQHWNWWCGPHLVSWRLTQQLCCPSQRLRCLCLHIHIPWVTIHFPQMCKNHKMPEKSMILFYHSVLTSSKPFGQSLTKSQILFLGTQVNSSSWQDTSVSRHSSDGVVEGGVGGKVLEDMTQSPEREMSSRAISPRTSGWTSSIFLFFTLKTNWKTPSLWSG